MMALVAVVVVFLTVVGSGLLLLLPQGRSRKPYAVDLLDALVAKAGTRMEMVLPWLGTYAEVREESAPRMTGLALAWGVGFGMMGGLVALVESQSVLLGMGIGLGSLVLGTAVVLWGFAAGFQERLKLTAVGIPNVLRAILILHRVYPIQTVLFKAMPSVPQPLRGEMQLALAVINKTKNVRAGFRELVRRNPHDDIAMLADWLEMSWRVKPKEVMLAKFRESIERLRSLEITLITEKRANALGALSMLALVAFLLLAIPVLMAASVQKLTGVGL